MSHIQWARASQFNWVYDNLGGVPLMAAAAGRFDGAMTVVAADGAVHIQNPLPGGGRVVYVRGVWRPDTTFAWEGFWAEPMDGVLTNYYAGGSFLNQGEATILTLGTALPPGTPVQVFYLYYTGDASQKYEALNNYPCIRRAYRSREDYTYDFAVDRMLDLMVYLHLAGRERGEDFDPAIQFLWEAMAARQESAVPPLVYDSFERRLWERGPYHLYRGDSREGGCFEVFDTEMAQGNVGRVLHVRANLPAQADGAWWGYGLNWSLAAGPFAAVDRVSFKLQGRGLSRRLHHLAASARGSATLILSGDFTRPERTQFVVHMESGGEVGTATCRWSKDGGLTWEQTGVITGDRQHPVALWGGVAVYWEGGGGPDFVAGDYWTFWGGDPAEHPRRLLATLNDSAPGDPDPWSAAHTFVHAIPDRFSELTPFEIPFSQFWRRDNLIDDGDRVRGIWGAWYAAGQQGDNTIIINDREETEILFGDTFYTQRQVTWDLSPEVTAFGVWVGIDANRCSSQGRSSLNFLIKPLVSGANSLFIRVKVKDAAGSYFYRDQELEVNAWQRVTVTLEDMLLEAGVSPMSHPLQAVDIGISSAPPTNGAFVLTDLKFDGRQTFVAAARLRFIEFKLEHQGLPDQEWWLDDVGLNLMAQDPYPLAPRLAISLGPYGQNPWRGPTLVHYAQPLAPYLAGALNVCQTYVALHRDAQEDFQRRYGGLKGPILPVHTRNDIETIALCGEENFGKFCWWPAYRDYGKVAAAWHFNGALTDASGQGHDLAWSSGSAVYTTGLCQPGPTALSFDGSGKYAFYTPGTDFRLGSGDFTLELVVKFDANHQDYALLGLWAPDQKSWLLWKRGADNKLCFTWSVDGATVAGELAAMTAITDTAAFHHVVVARSGNAISILVDGGVDNTGSVGSAHFFEAGADLQMGMAAGDRPLRGALDYGAVHKGRAMGPAEVAGRWRIIQGLANGSAYPEVGHGLGQYWAFLRLAQYYFVSNDPAAHEILDNWLAWLDAVGAPDGDGWQVPVNFSEYGFSYGVYDPGAAASLALGCLYTYLRGGQTLAAIWARRLLDDLRLHRQSQEFGGGYKSDYHYAWLNALVIQAFGLAAHGLTGQAYPFAAHPEDGAHFQWLMTWLFRQAGDSKPNLLNADLLPFTYLETGDLWDYAPHYLATARMGSLEAVVLMLGAALAYAQSTGDWSWFERLWRFVLADNLVNLETRQIKALSTAYHLAGVKNVVRVYFADYDQDNSRYVEARDEAAMTAWGEAPVDLDLRYDSPVVLENPEVAGLLAQRLLKRLASPWEVVNLETWLEGARMEIGDTLAVTSPFHGYSREEFTVFGKALDLHRRRLTLKLARPFTITWAFAVEAEGSPYDAPAIDQASKLDPHWRERSYAV